MTADRQHIIAIPEVAHKGPHDTDASMFRRAAENLDRDFHIGGGNLKAAVSQLLRAAADALDARPTGLAERGVCGECGELIFRNHETQPWVHTDTQAPRCYRDPDTQVAYPDFRWATSFGPEAPDTIVDAEVVEDDEEDYPLRSVTI